MGWYIGRCIQKKRKGHSSIPYQEDKLSNCSTTYLDGAPNRAQSSKLSHLHVHCTPDKATSSSTERFRKNNRRSINLGPEKSTRSGASEKRKEKRQKQEYRGEVGRIGRGLTKENAE